MNPFELFNAKGIYKIAMLYFSKSRGLAIVGKCLKGDKIEVVQFSGEVDPHTGNFTALDYNLSDYQEASPVITRRDFENLVTFIEAKIDQHTRMSIIEPELIKPLLGERSRADLCAYIQ
jgi:hypothetical protein